MKSPRLAYDATSFAVISGTKSVLQRALLVMVGLNGSYRRGLGGKLLGIFFFLAPEITCFLPGNRLDLTLFSYVFLLFDIYSPLGIPCRN